MPQQTMKTLLFPTATLFLLCASLSVTLSATLFAQTPGDRLLGFMHGIPSRTNPNASNGV